MDLTIHTGSFGIFMIIFGFALMFVILLTLKDIVMLRITTNYSIKNSTKIANAVFSELDFEDEEEPDTTGDHIDVPKHL